MNTTIANLEILKGKTFFRIVRWESDPLVYKAITAIAKTSPVAITAPGHNLTTGWRAAVVSAGGMRQINAKNWPLRVTDFHKVTVISDNIIELNSINSADFNAYTSGGALVYFTPVSLAGFSARMQIRATAQATGAPLVSLVSPTNISIDDIAKKITLTISASETEAYTFSSGVYDLELVSPSGVVTQILSGSITIVPEVTRD